MGIFNDICKLGILLSFAAAIAYELTGSNIWKVFSIVTGLLSLTILSSYLTNLKHLNKAKDILYYLRLLK